MEDLIGKVFGRLNVSGFDQKKGNRYLWKCQCICGNIKSYRSDLLKEGRRKSCGCLKSPGKEEYLVNLEKRLLKNSHKVGECLEWKNRFAPSGHGMLKVKNKTMGAHRAAWMVWKGDIPGRMFVLHKCDNPKCINIDHLKLGTHHDNMKDMVDKNRQDKRPGEKHHMTNLTDQDVLDIRKIWDEGLGTQSGLAKKYNLSLACIYNIVKRKSWKHLP